MSSAAMIQSRHHKLSTRAVDSVLPTSPRDVTESNVGRSNLAGHSLTVSRLRIPLTNLPLQFQPEEKKSESRKARAAGSIKPNRAR